MNRLAALRLAIILLAWGVSLRPAAADTGFDSATAASVWSAALSYIAPRALIPTTMPQMALWGLNGLTALDPDLTARLQDGQIRLYGPDALLLAIAAPPAGDAPAWGRAAAAIAAAAYAASPALRQAGTQGVVDSFFDELFNHFDPYSRYEPPQQAAQDQLLVTGIASAGFALARQGNATIVGTVAADGPAAEAGLVPGTLVLAIDGRATAGIPLPALNAALNGLLGTAVKLYIRDPGDPTGFGDITLTRAFVPAPTVFAEMFSPDQTFLALKIIGFNKGTSDQFSAALVAGLAAAPAPDGLLIDLRGNRGGVLRQAVLMADTLLPAGKIAQAAGRDPDAGQNFMAEGSDLTGGLPIVLLVDGQTASAAEILAAALADDRRAVVVGSATLGKGLVQTLTPLPDGGELFVTWSRVLAPRGWPLQTLGVMPQLCTSLGQPALDAQFTALQAGRNLLAPVLAASRAARPDVPVGTILTIRDQCPAAIGGDLDIAAAKFLMMAPAAYTAALLPAG